MQVSLSNKSRAFTRWAFFTNSPGIVAILGSVSSSWRLATLILLPHTILYLCSCRISDHQQLTTESPPKIQRPEWNSLYPPTFTIADLVQKQNHLFFCEIFLSAMAVGTGVESQVKAGLFGGHKVDGLAWVVLVCCWCVYHPGHMGDSGNHLGHSPKLFMMWQLWHFPTTVARHKLVYKLY